MARVNIADNGIGIPADAHERIFRMFERMDEKFEGTGIGLAIVKSTVSRLGGSVGVQSTPGAGSTFWLDLHAAESGGPAA
jgi:signal transduction histidine kinase